MVQFTVVTKDHVLFCIDASASMHDPQPDEMFENEDFSRVTEPDVAKKIYGKGKSTLHVALEVAHKVERAKALTGPHDSVGVLLYNVNVGDWCYMYRDFRNSSRFQHIY